MSAQSVGLALFVVVGSSIVLGAPASTAVEPKAACDILPHIIDGKYPLTEPVALPDGGVKYRIALISDLDGQSVLKNETNSWLSLFKQGYLTYKAASKKVSVEWDPPTDGKRYIAKLSVNGRGAELSELVTYNGQLVTLDDKTGLVYLIENDALVPWVIVLDGNGRKGKVMKNEWATVKGSKLFVGSHGKEMVTDGGLKVKDHSMMWVKEIDADGGVKHLNWTDNFVKLRAAAGIRFPGYMTHESCVWSNVHGRWFFLPRKASTEPFNPATDERKGTNLLLSATPDFNDIKVVNVGKVVPNHGYSSFKFIPNTNDTVIAAINTQEEDDTTATFITAFTIHGEILFPETKVSPHKFEGIEFI